MWHLIIVRRALTSIGETPDEQPICCAFVLGGLPRIFEDEDCLSSEMEGISDECFTPSVTCSFVVDCLPPNPDAAGNEEDDEDSATEELMYSFVGICIVTCKVPVIASFPPLISS